MDGIDSVVIGLASLPDVPAGKGWEPDTRDPYDRLSPGAREIVLYIENEEPLYREWLAIAPVLRKAEVQAGKRITAPITVGGRRTRLYRAFNDLLVRAERAYDAERMRSCDACSFRDYVTREHAAHVSQWGSYATLWWMQQACGFLCQHLGDLLESGELASTADGAVEVVGV